MRGDRWGIDGPPEEAYSRLTNPERFQPLHDVAMELLDRLERLVGGHFDDGYHVHHWKSIYEGYWSEHRSADCGRGIPMMQDRRVAQLCRNGNSITAMVNTTPLQRPWRLK